MYYHEIFKLKVSSTEISISVTFLASIKQYILILYVDYWTNIQVQRILYYLHQLNVINMDIEMYVYYLK